MAKTPEQTVADNALEDAVKAVVAAYGLIPDGAIITDYMVMGEAGLFLDDGDSTCEMFTAFRNGHCRLTTAVGIIDLGKRHLMGHWSHDDED